jgi:hypothetical protein
MTQPPSWENRARRPPKAELARADIGYRELAERLKKGAARDGSIHRQQDQPGHILSDVLAGVPGCNRRGDRQTGGRMNFVSGLIEGC